MKRPKKGTHTDGANVVTHARVRTQVCYFSYCCVLRTSTSQHGIVAAVDTHPYTTHTHTHATRTSDASRVLRAATRVEKSVVKHTHTLMQHAHLTQVVFCVQLRE
jgi:hypothetical protein